MSTHRRTFFIALAFVPALVLAGAAGGAAAGDRGDQAEYEVWLTDQNNTAGFSGLAPRGTHGGRLLIFQGADLQMAGGPVNDPDVIDLAQMYSIGGPNNATGANVVRPHMVLPSPDHRYLALAFVASGHVAVIDAATRESKALFRMTAGAGGARQAHAGFWTADGSAIIVANQNGKLLERIDYDASTDTFTHNAAATLDLANCVTPSGNPCQSTTPLSDADPAYLGPNNRPDNAPICPMPTRRGSVLVSLRGGGLFVVDPTTEPMSIVAAYGNQFVGRDGCGGRQHRKDLFINGGTGTLATNPHEFSLYHLRDSFPRAPKSLSDNDAKHMPTVFFRPEHGVGADNRDAHGMAIVGKDEKLWQFDRLANVIEVFDVKKQTHLATIDLAGAASSDPTPDLVDVSPDGSLVFAALRGPAPQTGAHASAGVSPGLGIVRVDDDGLSGELFAVLGTSFLNPVSGSEESDPHGVSVVLRD